MTPLRVMRFGAFSLVVHTLTPAGMQRTGPGRKSLTRQPGFQ